MSAWPPSIPALPSARDAREVFMGHYTGHGVKRRLKKWSRPRDCYWSNRVPAGPSRGANDIGYSPFVIRLDGRITYANMASRALGIIPDEV